MIVKRGAEWGLPVDGSVDAVEVRSDAELAAALSSPRPRPVLVRGGDLHRSLGSPLGPAATTRLPIDLIAVTTEAGRSVAVAHVVVRRRGPLAWWRGPIVAAMNVDHLGRWDAAPRAHPNDGWLDIIEVNPSMSLRARWQAWRRLRSGSHVPHPDIAMRRVRAEAFTFSRPLAVRVDGVGHGETRSLRVEIEADAAAVYV
jgi:YegS C-terminal NAD kinase beta sandwich-like domain